MKMRFFGGGSVLARAAADLVDTPAGDARAGAADVLGAAQAARAQANDDDAGKNKVEVPGDETDSVDTPTDDAPGAPADEPAPAGDAAAQAAAGERARVASVFASEHSAGRERQAADMLQTSMSADEITGLLAKSPKGAAAADPMLAALAGTKNPDLGASASSSDAITTPQATDSVWDKARAKAR